MRIARLSVLLTAIVFSVFAYTPQTTLTKDGNRWRANGQLFDMWGIRVASATQNSTYTNHLLAQLDDYRAHGVKTVTVFFMGSSAACSDPFSSDGKSFRDTGALTRMKQIVEACDARGMVVIVGIFYQMKSVNGVFPAFYLADWTASKEAVKTVARELADYKNIVINIANEQNSSVYNESPTRPWKTVTSVSGILECCDAVHSFDADRIVGGGGYDHTNNDNIGKSSRCDVLLFDTDSWGDNSQTLYNRFVAAGVTNKPIVNVELFGGVTKDVPNCGNFTNYKNYYFAEVDHDVAVPGLSVFFHSNTWCQGPSSGCPLRFDLAGQGTSSDIGIRWYFGYIRSKINLGSAPTVSISSPINGATYNTPATVVINASASDDNSVASVKFYNGSTLLYTDNAAPYSYTWSAVGIGSYILTTVATDGDNLSTTSTPVSVSVIDPNAAPALFVVGNTSLSAGDAAIKSRLESKGYSVTVKAASASSSADATGKALVVVSATVSSGDVNTKFRDVALPVMSCENAIFDDMKMTASTSGSFGTQTSQMQVVISNSSSPLAAGLSGTIAVTTSPQTMVWGIPSSSATTIANIVGASAKMCCFAYEAGAGMVGMNAPARRVGFLLESSTAAALNTNGWALFDAAINYLAGAAANQAPSISLTAPANGTTFANPASIAMAATASDIDGSVAKVEFRAGDQILGEDQSAPYSFTWSNVSAGSYALTARATDNEGAVTVSSVVTVTVGSVNPGKSALLVVSSTSLSSADNAIKSRLAGLGFAVTAIAATSATSSSATGKSLVFVSATVNSGDVNIKFRNVAVPVIVSENAIQDDMMMTSATSGNFGTQTSQTQVTIVTSSHAMAAGLSGTVTILSSAQQVNWGIPSSSAVKIAGIVGQSTRIAVYGYEAGASMVGLSAPARRVGFMLESTTASYLNAAGWSLFDAAVNWASAAALAKRPDMDDGMASEVSALAAKNLQKMRVFDMSGRLVFSGATEVTHAVNASQFGIVKAGTYVVRIQHEGQATTRRIAIR